MDSVLVVGLAGFGIGAVIYVARRALYGPTLQGSLRWRSEQAEAESRERILKARATSSA